MNKQLSSVDINEKNLYHKSPEILRILLKDRTTKRNIVWGTFSYGYLGKGFGALSPISIKQLTSYDQLIQPRSEKSKSDQKSRTKINAEVFTPTWLVEKQVGVVEDEIGHLDLEDYISQTWLEITCGEAPYIVTRYDAVSGDLLPLSKRVGFLDKKLARISKEVSDEKDWLRIARKAYQTTYGYEWQGDSLLLARENLLLSFSDYYEDKYKKEVKPEVLKDIATIISYNLFQMDGLTYTTPSATATLISQQISLFDVLETAEIVQVKTQIKNWQKNSMLGFEYLVQGGSDMKFDIVIGNPPYQKDSGTSARDDAIYNFFYDEAEKISESYCLITPARFLFNAGSTPKKWNKKMLTDSHLKVTYYERDSKNVFLNTGIAGGVAILYRNSNKKIGPIRSFTSFPELNSIAQKINRLGEDSISTVISGRGIYRLTESLHNDYPNIANMQSKGHKNDIGTSAFDKFHNIIYFDKVNEEENFTKIFGRYENSRTFKFIRSEYVNRPVGNDKFRVILPKAYGTGITDSTTAATIIGEPFIINPYEGFTETYISVGGFDNKEIANNALKYIKTKFSRTLLAVLKITQDNTRAKWSNVPLQDFTVNSDIDWSQSVADIDRQLFRKYGLSQEEIAFIEEKVKAMD